MPTPVSSARQCLTDEAARALDDAVAVARRRSHSQTTSLHAVSALLSLPSSTLRDACARARSSAYSPRLQFRALELCVSVSLDRLTSSNSKTPDEEPPVSNSLMAAIKRSQANQRRHPETFHLYQMHQQLQSQSSSLSCVKVELKHFILSILDDPIVSRVFGDAGFRSSDIKLAILQPPPVSRFQKSMRFPPLFLCNLSDFDSNRSGFNFPFVVDNGEEDFKRIGQVLAKKTSKNPLLIGVSANNVLTGFTNSLKIGKTGFLPSEIDGLKVMGVDKEIGEFLVANLSEEMMGLKFKEVRESVESCTDGGGGVVVNFGDLKVFVDGESRVAAVDYVVSQLSSLVEVYGGKFWLIGAVDSYETYTKFSARFSSIEKEWDLSLLPITSSKLSTSGLPLKSSLLGSFVPFGGFFPAPTELENPSSSTTQSVSRCDLCNEKYEHEVSVILKGERSASVPDQQSTSLASWMQTPESETTKGISAVEAKIHDGVLNARLMGLQKKWNDICQRLRHNQTSEQNSSQIRARVPLPEPFASDVNRAHCDDKDLNQYESKCRNLSPSIQGDLQEKQSRQLHVSSAGDDNNLQHKPVDLCATTKHSSTSSSSMTSVTTDLGLGTIYVSPEIEPTQQEHIARLRNFSGTVSTEIDEMSKKTPYQIARCSENDFKQLYRALADKVRDQDDAICAISQTISRCRTGNVSHRGSAQRKDIWLMFLGPDQIGKKKIAAALGEVILGSRESLIFIDLNFENRICDSSSIFDSQGVSFCDLSFRGKTVTDYIAEELSKKPHSIVFLENIDKADFLAQNSLSQAIRTGKLADTHGREISINNTIFLTTSSSCKESEEILSPRRDLWGYSEERILKARALQMRIVIGSVSEYNSSNVLLVPKQLSSKNPTLLNKRKLVETSDFEIIVPAVKKSKSCFDLNLPVEEAEGIDSYENSENDSVSETKEAWLEEFLEQVDEKVVFKAFDFNSLAENILKEIGLTFQKTVGSSFLLEIHNDVVVQILAAYWLSDRKTAVKEWIDTVLYRGFKEVEQKQCLDTQATVKLVAIEGHNLEHALCACLPGKIYLN